MDKALSPMVFVVIGGEKTDVATDEALYCSLFSTSPVT